MISVVNLTSDVVRAWLPPRKKDAHKGDCGRVLIVAGSQGMTGAAVLCSMGAVRSGAGLVRTAIVKSRQDAFVKRVPVEVTSQALPEDVAGHVSRRAINVIRKTIQSYRPTVIAAGPGLGTSSAVRQLISFLVFKSHVPIVLDADGLNALSEIKKRTAPSAPLILTPHPGEMGRLLKWSARKISKNRAMAAVKAAQRYRAVCLLKGAGTMITGGARVWRNTTGNPAMATGGMGDVLTGMIASIWGQMPEQDGASGLRSAGIAAYWHGLAADLASKDFPARTLLASDVAAMLPAALKKLLKRK